MDCNPANCHLANTSNYLPTYVLYEYLAQISLTAEQFPSDGRFHSKVNTQCKMPCNPIGL
jgi:hypothetical protein